MKKLNNYFNGKKSLSRQGGVARECFGSNNKIHLKLNLGGSYDL